MNRFEIHRGYMDQIKMRNLAGHFLASKASWPAGSIRGWSVWVLDSKAWLFKGQRVLVCDWFLFCDFIREIAI